MIQDPIALLRANDYPGRGMILGCAPGGQAVAAYFIMGRSENSRNRVFAETEDGIRTQARDPALLRDPSLILYHPVRQLGRALIVANGDQSDTIRDALTQGGTFEDALRRRTFEPDGPHWTPRISGLLQPDGSCRMAILKCIDGRGLACTRQFFEYPALPGVGHLLHTYQSDGDPLPPFQGEPVPVAIPANIDAFADGLWDALHRDNKIALYVRYAGPAGAIQVRLRGRDTGKETTPCRT